MVHVTVYPDRIGKSRHLGEKSSLGKKCVVLGLIVLFFATAFIPSSASQSNPQGRDNDTIRIAAIQMVVNFCYVDSNLARAERLIRGAFNKGAEWVILPEFFTSAMGIHPQMLDAACPIDGKPMQLLVNLAREYHGVIGGSFIAFRNGRANNTFVLAFPDGSTFLHDKDIPSFCENCYYVGGKDDGVLDTPSGRVGVALCWEFIRSGTASRMLGRVDMVVGGSCWWGGRDPERLSFMQQTPVQFARMLGVPVVHAAHAGTFHGFSDTTYRNPHLYEYVGETLIIDGSGQILARMSYEDGEGFIIAEVRRGEVGNMHEPIPNRFWIPADLPQWSIDSWARWQVTGYKFYQETTLPYYSKKWTSIAIGEENIPQEFVLWQNHPNPFNPTTVVSYQLPVASQVRLVVFDLLGREVATLVDENKPAGVYEVQFDASELAGGVYLYRMQAGTFVETRKLILLR